MQPLIAAMKKVRQAFYAAIVRSLLRTKSVLQTILNLWISPSIVRKDDALSQNGAASASNGDLSGKRKLQLEEFLEDVKKEFRERVERKALLDLSDGIRRQLKDSLVENPQCMLPSYNHQLPTGNEQGTYLALDVGGSTFRVGLVELSGRKEEGQESKILISKSFKIDNAVRQLRGVGFFDWMAQHIQETLVGQSEGHTAAPLSMGLAWSFPIEQTSLRSGLLQGMGKGFLAAEGIIGQDLGDLIQDSCSRIGLNVHLNAIVNDSSATLLSKAYLDPTTRFALILGTGSNAAVHLPVHIFSSSKFGVRPAEWHASAEHVIVNTELSMFGGGILPLTRWDEEIKAVHPRPDFQPLEHFVAGGYLGEIARRVLVEGIRTAGLFGGVVPASLMAPYSLGTETISRIEGDRTPNLATATQVFTSRHPTSTPPTYSDILALHTIASQVSFRAAAILATGVHSLWQLRNESESIEAQDSKHTLVAYNGSVIEHYPRFREMCQKQLDGLVQESGAWRRAESLVELVYAEESSLLGAAVAVACLDS